jgi:hypothetical protein
LRSAVKVFKAFQPVFSLKISPKKHHSCPFKSGTWSIKFEMGNKLKTEGTRYSLIQTDTSNIHIRMGHTLTG